ncbi:hypothetical protein Tco_1212292 [Tanacetum coccineum]
MALIEGVIQVQGDITNARTAEVLLMGFTFNEELGIDVDDDEDDENFSLFELFGVESPSEESHCSLPLRALCSCLPLAPYAALSFEPLVSSVVVIGVAVVMIVVVIIVAVVVIVVVIVAAVVVESLVGLAKVRRFVWSGGGRGGGVGGGGVATIPTTGQETVISSLVEFDESGKVIGATSEGETARCQTVAVLEKQSYMLIEVRATRIRLLIVGGKNDDLPTTRNCVNLVVRKTGSLKGRVTFMLLTATDDVDMSENDLQYTGYIVDATDGSGDGSKQTASGVNTQLRVDPNILQKKNTPNVVGKVIAPKDIDLEKSHQTLQPARNPLRLCGICVSINDRDDCNTSSSTSVPYDVSNLSTISHQQNHQGTHFTLQPARNPLRLCGICVSIDDHDNCNTSSSTSVPYGVSNLSTISHQQNHQALKTAEAIIPMSSEAFESSIKETFAKVRPVLQFVESAESDIERIFFALKTTDVVLPTSYEAFESLIKETFAKPIRLKIALLRPVSRAVGTGNTAIAMGMVKSIRLQTAFTMLVRYFPTGCYCILLCESDQVPTFGFRLRLAHEGSERLHDEDMWQLK